MSKIWRYGGTVRRHSAPASLLTFKALALKAGSIAATKTLRPGYNPAQFFGEHFLVQVGAVLAQTAQCLSLRVSSRPTIVHIVNNSRRSSDAVGCWRKMRLREVRAMKKGEEILLTSSGRTIEITQRIHLRTEILMALRAVYPKSMSIVELQSSLEQRRDIGQNPLLVELNYLHDKELLSLKTSRKNASVRITVRGIDYLDGHIQEVGLASPDLYQVKFARRG